MSTFQWDETGNIIVVSDGELRSYVPRGSPRFKTLTTGADAVVVDVYAPPVPSVPTVVSNAQAKAALNAAGLLDAVQAQVDASPDDELRIAWEYAPQFERGSDLLNALATSIGLTSEQMDDLFTAAAAITF